MTLVQLIAIPYLRTRCLAGSAGMSRTVQWAHVCEVAHPEEWLGEGELLMTTGLVIPQGPDEQVQLVEALAKAGIAGLMIGEAMHAPVLSPAMLAAAERCNFPLLSTEYSVPFSAVTRAIAESGQEETRRAQRLVMHFYEIARTLMQDALTVDAVMEKLAAAMGAKLWLLEAPFDEKTSESSPPLELLAQVEHLASNREGPLPALLRLPDSAVVALPLARPQVTLLLLLPQGKNLPSLTVLQHAAVVLALALEHRDSKLERRRRLGAELLDDLRHERLSAELAAERLRDYGFSGRASRLLRLPVPSPQINAALHGWLDRLGVVHLVRKDKDCLVVLIDGDDALLARVAAFTGRPVGVSSVLVDAARIGSAWHEAEQALAQAQKQGGVVHYGEGDALSILLSDDSIRSEMFARLVLGGVLDGPPQVVARRLHTLEVFLECDRSWQQAATSLHIHKQTLVYRMHQLEKLCNRNFKHTQDVATLWLALRAARLAGFHQLG